MTDIAIYKISAGRTEPGATKWEQYKTNSITVEVDTSAANFEKTVIYTTSLAGKSHHWEAIGGSSVYSPTSKGFKIYVKFAEGATLTPEIAKQNKWHVNWIGVEVG
jgi:hypothetical protein